MKKKFSKEVKIGIAFVIALFILYFGINFLKGINVFKPSNSYTVVFDNVTGLTLSSPVVMNGFQVGLVYSMKLENDTANKVAVILNLDKGVRLNKGSKVKLDVSLMGTATVILEQNPYTEEYYTIDDRIPGVRIAGMMESLGGDVMPQIGALVPKIDSILMGLQLLVNNPALVKSLENVEVITSDLAVSSKQLNQMMLSLNKNIPTMTNNMTTVSNDLAGMTTQLKSIDIASSYNSIDSTLRNVQGLSSKLNSKDSSLGLLLNDRALYDSLNVTISNASLLLKDVKENPSRYINVKVF